MSPDTGGAAQWQAMQEVPFQSQWRDSGGPQTVPAWSYDETFNTVYAFFDISDEKVAFELEYVVNNGVRVYNDVAELYWQFVGFRLGGGLPPMWRPPSRFPCRPARKWWRATRCALGATGPWTRKWPSSRTAWWTSMCPGCLPGEYAEARIAFPAEWVSQVDPSVTYGYDYLDSILAEEQQWADEANARRTLVAVAAVRVGGLCLVSIAVAVVLYFRFGRRAQASVFR